MGGLILAANFVAHHCIRSKLLKINDFPENLECLGIISVLEFAFVFFYFSGFRIYFKFYFTSRHRKDNCKEEHAAKWRAIAQKSSLLRLLYNERDKVIGHDKRTKS